MQFISILLLFIIQLPLIVQPYNSILRQAEVLTHCMGMIRTYLAITGLMKLLGSTFMAHDPIPLNTLQ